MRINLVHTVFLKFAAMYIVRANGYATTIIIISSLEHIPETHGRMRVHLRNWKNVGEKTEQAQSSSQKEGCKNGIAVNARQSQHKVD